MEKIPRFWPCQKCKNRVELHELRKCSSCLSGRDRHKLYCIRICRIADCRTKNCAKPGHETCWALHLPREEDEDSPHVMVDPLPELFVSNVTYSEKDERVQRKLHEEDRTAQWFTIKMEKRDHPKEVMRLCLTDRFRQLCNPGITGSRWSTRQYPGFVSFIGNTGIGKSTLLKAMILMGQIDPTGTAYRAENGTEQTIEEVRQKMEALRVILATKACGPVTRSANLSHMTDPTSFGVHLYRDESVISMAQGNQTAMMARETPILFVDCEGFQAGQARTNAELADPDDRQRLISDLSITASSYAEAGKNGVDLFYARFLYAISDVIVFVMTGDTMHFSEMQKLVEWAACAVHRSVNHVAHKTLIIVRNMPSRHDKELYNEDVLRLSLAMKRYLWEGSTILKEFRDDFNANRNDAYQIQDNNKLIKQFFKKIRFCYIPNAQTVPSSEIFRQYQQLRYQIVQASERSQIRRSGAWMQYNVPMLSHILNRAFEHFRTSDLPFDFYEAARNDNPNPESVSDHIANFLRHLHLASVYPPPPPAMIHEVVAINLVSWALRTFGLFGEPEEIFSHDPEAWCEKALDIFQKKDQRCGYQIEGGGSCINCSAAHRYEHCDENGNRAPGEFDKSKGLSPNTKRDIKAAFVNLYKNACRDQGHITWPDSEQARKARKAVLQEYRGIWKVVQSNKSCLACFQAVPDHVLKCGHGFCAQCVQEFGDPSLYFESSWIMDECALCSRSWQGRGNTYRVHPRCAGVRALTLDGGGIRGIVEIVLLEKLHAAIGFESPLRDYFDIIMGTSTGGIIALSLATQEQLIGDLKKEFISIASRTFERTRLGGIPSILNPGNWASKVFLGLRIWDSLYRTTPLRGGLQSLFGPDRKLFSAAERPVRVAVTSSKDNGADKCLITNYNRPKLADDTDFEREDESNNEMKIWEAALATSAAPYYFRKFEKRETKKDYTDGALHANFPVPYTLEEISRIWALPSGETLPLDILIALGTGIQKREVKIPVALKIGGFDAICASFLNSIDCESRWQEFASVRGKERGVKGKVHRLTTKISGYVSLDDYKKMEEIEADIAGEFAKDEEATRRLEEIADILIANLFFFEPTLRPKGVTPSSPNTLQGSIRCRLARDSSSLKSLVDAIDKFWYRSSPLALWSEIPFDEQDRHGIKNGGKWLRVEHTIEPGDNFGGEQALAVSLRRGKVPGRKSGALTQPIPISGFPSGFESLRRKAGGS